MDEFISFKRVVPRGQLILRKGQAANKYFFIVSGGIRFSMIKMAGNRPPGYRSKT
jgi:CRP-like cAMP-binding protein